MPEAFVNGVSIYYETHGNGFPLVLIAGLGHGGWSFFRQVDDFARDFKVVVFDNRGVGRSARPKEGYSINVFAEDTLALLREIGLEKAHVLGASMGGYVAQTLAWAHPECVEKLVLVSTMFGGPSAKPMTQTALNFFTSRPQGTPEDIVRQGLALATSEGFVERNPEVVEKVAEFQLAWPQNGSAYIGQLSACGAFLADPQTESHLREIQAPTLVVAGSDDKVVPAENAVLLAERIPGARVTIMENAGHLLFIEKPREFNELVTGFLLER